MRRVHYGPSSAAAAVGLVCALLLGARGRAATPEEAYRVLSEYSVPFETNAFEQSVAGAILRAADPGAMIVDTTNAIVSPAAMAAAEALPKGILYLKLNGVFAGAALAVTSEIDAWTNSPKTGIVIDLRGAGGDSLDGVDEIAGLFLPEMTPLYTVKQHGEDMPEQRSSKGMRAAVATLPVMLLIDETTGQASVALAAAIKNRCRVMLIGMTTRGEGVVRRYVPLNDTQSVHLATATLSTLEGQPLSEGVEADITVPTHAARPAVEDVIGAASSNGRPLSLQTLEDIRLVERVRGDPPLMRATDILIGLHALRAEDGTYLGMRVCDEKPAPEAEPQPPAAVPSPGTGTNSLPDAGIAPTP